MQLLILRSTSIFQNLADAGIGLEFTHHGGAMGVRFGPNAALSGGWHESVGLGVLTLFDALRFDVARGLRGGRWTFAVDFTRDFWRIL